MADMIASLAQTLTAGPADTQAVRSQHSRPFTERKDAGDDPVVDRIRESEQSQPRDNAPRAAADNPEAIQARTGSSADRTEAPQDKDRTDARDFRKILQRRIVAPQAEQTADTDKAELAGHKKKTDSPPAFAALAGLMGENPFETLRNKAAFVSGGRHAQHAAGRAAPGALTRHNAAVPDKTATSKDANSPLADASSTAKVPDSDPRQVKEQKAVADKPLQVETQTEKAEMADKNVKNSTLNAENDSKRKLPAAEHNAIAGFAGQKQRTPAEMPAQDKMTPDGHPKAGEQVQVPKEGGAAAKNLPTEAETGLHGPKGPAATASADQMTAGEKAAADGESAKSSPTPADAPASAGGASAEIAQALKASQDTAPTELTGRPTAAPVAAAQAAARPGALNAAAEHPAEQIIQSIRLNDRGPRQEIDIRLQPTELGSVRMRFHHADGEVRGILFVDKAQTRYEIERELPQIVASLQQNGVQIKKLEVVMNQQDQQNAGHGQTHGDAFAEAEHGRFEKYPYGGGSSGLEYSEEASGPDGPPETEPHQSRISDEAINIYV
ncbi:MAG: flagellar hook-length control protein FliK [Phycisphaerae bacterium]|nr:flagellar hook-length control protein FliK [Phycisphaerae bacterium]